MWLGIFAGFYCNSARSGCLVSVRHCQRISFLAFAARVRSDRPMSVRRSIMTSLSFVSAARAGYASYWWPPGHVIQYGGDLHWWFNSALNCSCHLKHMELEEITFCKFRIITCNIYLLYG